MHREIIEKLLARGFDDAADAERALRATLAALGERLTFDEARRLALALPGDATLFWQESSYDSDFDAAELYERVRRREGISLGRARERAQTILEVLGSVLPDEARLLLLRKLPAELAVLLEPRAESAPPAHPVRMRSRFPQPTLQSSRPTPSFPYDLPFPLFWRLSNYYISRHG